MADALAEAIDLIILEEQLCAGFYKLPTDNVRHLWIEKRLGSKYTVEVPR